MKDFLLVAPFLCFTGASCSSWFLLQAKTLLTPNLSKQTASNKCELFMHHRAAHFTGDLHLPWTAELFVTDSRLSARLRSQGAETFSSLKETEQHTAEPLHSPEALHWHRLTMRHTLPCSGFGQFKLPNFECLECSPEDKQCGRSHDSAPGGAGCVYTRLLRRMTTWRDGTLEASFVQRADCCTARQSATTQEMIIQVDVWLVSYSRRSEQQVWHQLG